MKHSRRILAVAAAVVLLMASLSFASGALIVRPAQNSIIDTDTLLVSVKLTDKETVIITVFEEKISVKLDKPNEDGKSYELVSVDPSAFTEEDLALIAEGKLKDENGKDILLSDGTKLIKYVDSVFAETESYTNTKSVGIYTKQLSDLTPGLYKVKVDVLGNDGATVSSLFNIVAVKEKTEKTEEIFNAQQNSGIKTTIQSILNKIFK